MSNSNTGLDNDRVLSDSGQQSTLHRFERHQKLEFLYGDGDGAQTLSHTVTPYPLPIFFGSDIQALQRIQSF